MSDEKPDLTKTEMRQANSRRTNLRVLVIGVVVVAIGFALALWYNTAVTPDTETTTEAGETLDGAPVEDVTDTDMDEGALPVPTEDDNAVVEDPAPVVEDPVVDVTPQNDPTADGTPAEQAAEPDALDDTTDPDETTAQ